jgi:hypothetical protein
MMAMEQRDPRFAELDAAIKDEEAAVVVHTPRNPRARKSARVTPRKARPRKRQTDARRSDHPTLGQGKQLAHQFAEFIRKKHGQQLNRTECIQVARVFRANVVPKRKPGRHPHAEITEAVAMRESGKLWPTIFEAIIPNWGR